MSPTLCAERLAVPQVRRAGERVDLAAGVVDIIFADDGETRRFEQAGERIADHRAAAMPHVHRPGRIGRDIFDIDPLARPDRAAAIAIAFAEHRRELAPPRVVGQPQVDEPRPRDADFDDVGQGFQLGRDQSGKRARVGPGSLGEHHRGIGREVAMGSIARRLDRDRLAIEPRRERALGFKGVEDFVEKRGISGV